jgi:hypothetical protein
MSVPAPLWRRRTALVEAKVDGELIGLHVDFGTCYGFNPTATRIWTLLDQPHSLAALCRKMELEFDVQHQDCAEAVLALLRELESEGLVEEVPADSNRLLQ